MKNDENQDADGEVVHVAVCDTDVGPGPVVAYVVALVQTRIGLHGRIVARGRFDVPADGCRWVVEEEARRRRLDGWQVTATAVVDADPPPSDRELLAFLRVRYLTAAATH